ncbi:Bug family tripartite tricarboxylate transporter substrate binding protein [Sabulicella rubraurantiaca]|uniref:Bug family tripartite tricarboxylate transporter substrate binding protein n=1 Tax=Sabulicella rubraurantiaca TaxID=2811429 RepID=UPI001A95C897|nr:tripartite tricarboxylate transporter substrate binding protein [Sabulicella rubraurantiaca]
MLSRRQILRSALPALPLMLGGAPRAGLAQGDAWPTRPVRIVVAWAPGGAVDTIARRLAPKLSEALGQPVVVENKSGATGTIGAADVARAAPDGHTLLAMDNTYAMLPYLFQRLPFDHATAFRPVTVSAFSPVMLAVHRDAPWRDLASLMEAAKREPEKITFGTGGIGSAPHFSTAAFAQAAGVRLFHVPFRGAGDAVTAVLARQVDMVMVSLGSALGHVQGGMLRVLAISGTRRTSALPDVPTFREAGMANFGPNGEGVVNWSGLAAPARTPEAIVTRLQGEVAKALQAQEVRDFLASIASEPGGMPPAAFAALLAEETARWSDVARTSGIEKQ